MADTQSLLLPPSRWRVVDSHTWRTRRDFLLGREATDPELARAVMVGDGVPDSFTVAERMTSRPLWLDVSERDGAVWLRDLVARRVAAVRHLRDDHTGRESATAHVRDQVRRVLELPDITGESSAETLWNQEIPYVVDRVIGQCLFDDPHVDPDPMPRAVVYSHRIASGLLDWFTDHHAGADITALTRYALAAGLVDLGIKGGVALCPPLDARLHPDADSLGAALVDTAVRSPMPVDHIASLVAAVGHGPARLVWFTDDVVETAFDLLVIQHLTWLNPRLWVLIAARSRRADNDATHHDLTRLLRHRAVRHLAGTVDAGRVQVTTRGPGMAAPLLDKLHSSVLRELDWADAVVVKGGRNHELLAGTLNRPLWTGYVVTREFTESQAGYDGRDAPLMFVHAAAGQRSWWGWRGRAHRRLAVAADRAIPACWVTIADRERRTSTDPETLAADLAWLLDSWPDLCHDYSQPARSNIRDLAECLARTTRGLSRDHTLIHQAQQITDHNPGAPTS